MDETACVFLAARTSIPSLRLQDMAYTDDEASPPEPSPPSRDFAAALAPLVDNKQVFPSVPEDDAGLDALMDLVESAASGAFVWGSRHVPFA